MARGPFNLQSYKSNKLPLRAYEWNMISPDTLRDMRTEAEKNQWMCKNVGEIIATIEDYFFFSGQKEHWFYQTCGEVIMRKMALFVFNGDPMCFIHSN